MGADDYFAALEKLAVRNACKGEGELRLSKADLDRVPSGFIERINAELKDGSVKLAAQGADIENGFILVYGDIEINCTFRALINEQKDTIPASTLAESSALRAMPLIFASDIFNIDCAFFSASAMISE